jgi:hypothetical protein
MNQNEKNLAGFINLLQTSLSDVDSFRKNDVSSYFLMLEKFFINYVNENNKKYEFENPLYIKREEAEKITYFFNTMVNLFENSKGPALLFPAVLNGSVVCNKNIIFYFINSYLLPFSNSLYNLSIKNLLSYVGIFLMSK